MDDGEPVRLDESRLEPAVVRQWPQPADTPGDKRATRVARQILEDVRAAGWPVGQVLGAEDELVVRYDVSRAVFREAVRLVEHQGVATTRRGQRGGLVISEPSMDAVCEAALTYLLFTEVTIDEVFAVRAVVEGSTAALAARRASLDDLEALRQRAQAESSDVGPKADRDERHVLLHILVARASGNPAAELFVTVLSRLSSLFVPPQRPAASSLVLRTSAQAHRRIVASIADGRSDVARQQMQLHLRRMGQWITDHDLTARLDSSSVLSALAAGKRGQQVARAIVDEIVTSGLSAGTVLGSETELAHRHGVSRNVLREAVRLLELHSVAAMRRGPGGGLVVSTPDARATVGAARAYIDHRRITPAQLTEIRMPIQCYTVGLAAQRATPEQVTALRSMLERQRAAGFRGSVDQGVDVAMAELSGNRVATLFLHVLAELSRQHTQLPDSPAGRALIGETYRARQRIIDAVGDHDPETAQRRTERFLTALQAHLR